MNALMQFAAKSGAEDSFFAAIGIDWKMLILQIIAFLIFVWVLAKFVYPTLIKTIDERQEAIEQTAKAAAEAEAHAKESEEKVEQALKQARKEAGEIISAAQKEAAAVSAEIEEKAKKQASHIASEAKEQIKQDIRDAKKALRSETTELVALATEKIVKQKVDAKTDKALIDSAIKEVE